LSIHIVSQLLYCYLKLE